MDCSVQNQGCDGGYPYLVEKFGEEFHLIDDECRRYTQQSPSNQCQKKLECNLKRYFRTYDKKYVGGAYGMSNEYNMLHEIYTNGPIVVSFEPDAGFVHYQSGIYAKGNFKNWASLSNIAHQPEWYKVDHSVLCYGFGWEMVKD